MVMGIMNVTPDSFFDGGTLSGEKEVVEKAAKMLADGAAILDVGAQSTRPGAGLITAEEEWSRLDSNLKALRKSFPQAIISIDTFYADVAEKAIGEGADMINDISGGSMDEKMFTTIARLQVPYVLMHIKGTPRTMQQEPVYEHVVKEVLDFFTLRIHQLVSLGAADIIIDPGFGFGKTLEHNFEILSHLELFSMFDRPILAGISRKSMVTKVTGTKSAEALNGTSVLHTIALQKGATILRVHDVKEAMEAIKLTAMVS